MRYAETLTKATSLAFMKGLDRDILTTLKNVGISAVELSFSRDVYLNTLQFPSRAAEYGRIAEEVGITLWSIHLPFSRVWDISTLDEENNRITMETNMALIRAAKEAGIRVAVLHPSSEPITDEERPLRLKKSRENILKLASLCRECGLLLAVENLPRTCLCNRAEEMIALLEGTGAGIVFDTNHALAEDNLTVLSSLIDSGLPIHSLHISDYDFVDERHRLPGDGVTPWQDILALLERGGYTGPLMYEVSRKPKERDELTVEELFRNMVALASGEIH